MPRTNRSNPRAPTLLLVALLTLTGLVALAAPSAEARNTRPYEGELSPAETPSGFSYLAAGAAEASTGDLLVFDNQGAPDASGAIDRFGPDGTFISQITGADTPEGKFSQAVSIAVDQSAGATKGRIYVSGEAIYALKPNGKLDTAFGGGGYIDSKNSPINTNIPQNLTLAVDPTNGHLLVAEPNSNELLVFDSSGNYLGEVEASIQTPREVAVDSTGNLYVVANEGITKLEPRGGLKYKKSEILTRSSGEGLVATNLANDHVTTVVAGVAREYGANGALLAQFGEGTIGGSPAAVAASPGGQISVVEPYEHVFLFGPVGIAPEATTLGTTDLTATSATISAEVDPEGGTVTSCEFEYGTTEGYGQVADCEPAPPLGEVATVIASLGELQSGTTYHYRIVAGNGVGSAIGEDRTFITRNVPLLSSIGAFGVGPSLATLSARLNPGGLETRYHFEFGTTTSYGTTVPVPDGIFGPDYNEPVEISESAYGLQINTTYHFRVVATNQLGTTVSPDFQFTTNMSGSAGPTSTCPNEAIREEQHVPYLPDCRAYELVSPPKLPGIGISTYKAVAAERSIRRGSASPDGARVIFSAATALHFPGDPGDNEVANYVGERSPIGWTSRYVGGPSSGLNPLNQFPKATLGEFSEDLTFYNYTVDGETFDSSDPFLPHDSDIYSRELGSEKFHWVSRSSYPHGPAYRIFEAANSSNGRHSVFGSSEPLTSAENSGEGTLYMESGLDPEVVSRAVDGSVLHETVAYAVSDDGNLVLFGDQTSGELLLRVRGEARTISLGHLSGTPEMSKDGRSVVFATPDSLSGEDGDSSVDIYSYEPARESFELLDRPTTGAIDSGRRENCAPTYGTSSCDASLIVTSDDFSTSYFISPERLAHGAVGDAPNLYRVHSGAPAELVATLDPRNVGFGEAEFLGSPATRPVRTSDDGSVLIFESRGQLTDFDNEEAKEIYRFAADDADHLQCASCPQGQPLERSRDARFGGPFLGQYIFAVRSTAGRNLDGDGSKVFFESPERLVSADTNGVYDVYEYDASAGRLKLLSSGTAGFGSAYVDNSVDGRDVFIQTFDSLVAQDENGQLAKLYDVRVDGGFPGDRPKAPCEGSECQGAAGGSPAKPSPATESGMPRRLRRITVFRPSASARRKAAKTGRLAIEVFVAQPARLKAFAAGVFDGKRHLAAKATRSVESGRSRLVLKFSRRARRLLAKGEALRLSIVVDAPEAESRRLSVDLRRSDK